ncbi:prestin-like isoform X2 [Styela clava]
MTKEHMKLDIAVISPVIKTDASVNVTRPAYNELGFNEAHGRKEKEHKTVTQKAARWAGKKATCSWMRVWATVVSFIPVFGWLPKYKLRYLTGDMISGMTVGIIRIPQGMAYALLANVSPVYGLYSCFFPVLLWFVFTTSKHTSIGTMAVVCLMIQNLVSKYVPETEIVSPYVNGSLSTEVEPGTVDQYFYTDEANMTTFDDAKYIADQTAAREEMKIQYASTATLLVGIMQIAMAFLRLGFLTNFLSDPVVQGFTTGAAFHVLTSQVKYLFGLDKSIGKYNGPGAIVRTYIDIFKNLPNANVAEIVISLICFPSILIVKHLNDKYKKKMHNIPFPIELVMIIIVTLASYFGNLDAPPFNVNTVKHIPTGMPSFQTPRYISHWGEMISDCLIISIISFAISLSLTKIFADKHGYEIDPNQELFALGLCNLIPAFLSSFAIAASLSRTAIQESAGGNTQLVSVLSSILMLIVLLWLGPLFEPVPKSALAVIIIVALKNLFLQFEKLKALWSVSKFDFVIWLTTCVAVIFLGVDLGLGVGIGVAIIVLMLRIQRPKHILLGRIPYTDLYEDPLLYPGAEEIPGVKIFHYAGSLCFTNKETFRESVLKALDCNPVVLLAKKEKEERRINKENKREKNGRVNKAVDETGRLLDSKQSTEFRTVRYSEIKQEDEDQRVNETNISSAQSSGERPTNSPHQEETSIRKRRGGDTGTVEDMSVVSSTDSSISKLSVSKFLTGFHTLIFDASKWSFIDSTAAREVVSLVSKFQALGVRVLIAAASSNVMHTLDGSGLCQFMLRDKVFVTVHDACVYAEKAQRMAITGSNLDIDPEGYSHLPGYPGFDALAL